MQLGGKGCRSRCIPHQIGEKCHENASDCLRLDRCGGDAGDTSTRLLLTRLPSRRTMPGVLRSVPAMLCSAPAILWSVTTLLRLRLGQPNPAVDENLPVPCEMQYRHWKCRRRCSHRADEVI